jgi:hypothetical protein
VKLSVRTLRENKAGGEGGKGGKNRKQIEGKEMENR